MVLRMKDILGDVQKIFEPVVLMAGQAKQYIQSMETRKPAAGIYTYPLWDYPLLKIGSDYFSHLILLTESFQELAYRFIASSQSALSRFTQKEHEKLIEKVVSILKEQEFTWIKKNV
jgi:hypothetical protein